MFIIHSQIIGILFVPPPPFLKGGGTRFFEKPKRGGTFEKITHRGGNQKGGKKIPEKGGGERFFSRQ